MDEAGVPYVLICPQRVGTYAHWDRINPTM